MKGEVGFFPLKSLSCRVDAVIVNRVFSWLRDLSQNTSEKLEDIHGFALRRREQGVIAQALGLIEKGSGALCPMNAGETQRASK